MSGTAFVVLAAGAARRFGGGKLDAALANVPLGLHACGAVESAGAKRRAIVVPPTPPGFLASLEGWTTIVNPDADRGIGTSIRAAIAALCDASRIVITLADMPFVPPGLLRELAQGDNAVFTRHADCKPGVPAAFPRRMFDRLLSLPDDKGAAWLAHEIEYDLLERPRSNALLDIDTAEDLGLAAAALSER